MPKSSMLWILVASEFACIMTAVSTGDWKWWVASAVGLWLLTRGRLSLGGLAGARSGSYVERRNARTRKENRETRRSNQVIQKHRAEYERAKKARAKRERQEAKAARKAEKATQKAPPATPVGPRKVGGGLL